MAIMRWNTTSLPDPFDELDRLQEEMNRLFGLTFRPDNTGIFDRSEVPAVDLLEEADRFLVLVDLPGIEKQDLELTVAPHVLTLRGERSGTKGGKAGKGRVYRDETWEGSFQRTISLPEGADTEKISAELSDGVLRIEIAKKAELKPRQISVVAK